MARDPKLVISAALVANVALCLFAVLALVVMILLFRSRIVNGENPIYEHEEQPIVRPLPME